MYDVDGKGEDAMWEKSIREKVYASGILTNGEWVYLVGAFQAASEVDPLAEENTKLRNALHAPLSSEELRLVDKNCDWVAFKHAWNAVMKSRLASLHA